MEDFPPNTHKQRERPEKTETPEAREVKKVERIIEGEVVRRRQSPMRRFKNVFFGGEAASVKTYLVMDVLLPAFKDMVADAASQGVERMLFGEGHHYGRRGKGPRGRAPETRVYTDYRGRGLSTRDERDRPPLGRVEERPSLSRNARRNHNFEDIILATRAEAEEVIDRLFDLVSRYETATVADLYELLGITSEFTDDKWGWTDIRGSDVRRVREGYLLDLPRPEPLS